MLPKLLHYRIFRILWIGRFSSIFGSRFLDFAFPWLILEMTGSPLAAGTVLAAEQLAPILLALPVGAWIERLPKKRTALIAESVRVLAISLLIILLITNTLTTLLFILIVFIMGISAVFFCTSYNLFLLHAVGRDRLREAYNLTEGADAIASAIGPAMAGVIYFTFGAEWAIAVTAIGFIASFITIAVVKIKEPSLIERPAQIQRAFLKQTSQDIAEGIAYISKTKFQRRFIFINIVLGFTTMASVLLIAILAQQNLGLNASQAGLLLSAMGLGAIVAVITLELLKNIAWNYVLVGSLVVSAVGAITLALSQHFATALVGAFLLDFGLAMAFVVHTSTHQIHTPNRLLARVKTADLTVDGISRLSSRVFAGGVTQLFDVRLPLMIISTMLVTGASVAFRTKEPTLEKEEAYNKAADNN